VGRQRQWRKKKEEGTIHSWLKIRFPKVIRWQREKKWNLSLFVQSSSYRRRWDITALSILSLPVSRCRALRERRGEGKRQPQKRYQPPPVSARGHRLSWGMAARQIFAFGCSYFFKSWLECVCGTLVAPRPSEEARLGLCQHVWMFPVAIHLLGSGSLQQSQIQEDFQHFQKLPNTKNVTPDSQSLSSHLNHYFNLPWYCESEDKVHLFPISWWAATIFGEQRSPADGCPHDVEWNKKTSPFHFNFISISFPMWVNRSSGPVNYDDRYVSFQILPRKYILLEHIFQGVHSNSSVYLTLKT